MGVLGRSSFFFCSFFFSFSLLCFCVESSIVAFSSSIFFVKSHYLSRIKQT